MPLTGPFGKSLGKRIALAAWNLPVTAKSERKGLDKVLCGTRWIGRGGVPISGNPWF